MKTKGFLQRIIPKKVGPLGHEQYNIKQQQELKKNGKSPMILVPSTMPDAVLKSDSESTTPSASVIS